MARQRYRGINCHYARTAWISPLAQRSAGGASSTPPAEEHRPLAGLHAERRLVELDLLVAADLVGELLPSRRGIVGAGLRVILAGEGLLQLVLGDAIIFEDAGDARLDGRVRMVVAVLVGVQVRGDIGLVVSGLDPLRDIEMAVP